MSCTYAGSCAQEGGSSDEGEALGRAAAQQADEGSLGSRSDADEQDDEEGTSPTAAPAPVPAHHSLGLA